MQRLRIKFRRGSDLKYISHLDLTRVWLRALRRADIPLVYSEGFSPHPRISIAAPLSVGVVGENELMDIETTKPFSPHWFINSVNRQLPHGIEVTEVFPVASSVASLQSMVRFARYRVEIATDKDSVEIETDINNLLDLAALPWHHERDTGRRNYDLRPLIEDIILVGCENGVCTLDMKLRCDEVGSGRPEQVALALGFKEYPRSISRTGLVLGRR